MTEGQRTWTIFMVSLLVVMWSIALIVWIHSYVKNDPNVTAHEHAQYEQQGVSKHTHPPSKLKPHNHVFDKTKLTGPAIDLEGVTNE